MKIPMLTTAIILAALTLSMGIYAGEKKDKTENAEVKKQTTCPVMGGKIDKAQYADVKGKRIYVCCAGCIAKIKADPEKYIKQMEAEGITLDKAEKKKMKSEDHSGHQH